MTKRISETALASQVDDLLSRFGWKWMHIKPSIMQSGRWASSMNEAGKGFLDYIALRPPRILVIELKDAYSKMTPEQEEWFKLWEECQRTLLSVNSWDANSKVIFDLSKKEPVLTIPEVYLWRPKDIEPDGGKILEVLKSQ